MVFIPYDFSNSYLVTHWTDPGNYATTSDAPFATSLINTTQILPPPTSHDTQASYAASDTALVQIDSAGNIYYITNAVQSNYDVAPSPLWTKSSYTLAGTGGSIAPPNSTTNSTTLASGSSTISSSASMTSAMSSSASGAAAGVTTGSSSASAAASATTSKAASGAGAGMERGDLLGLALGLVALTGAVIL
jgi:hypothetical protein